MLTERILLKLDAPLMKRVTLAARRDKTPRSEYIRRAIEMVLYIGEYRADKLAEIRMRISALEGKRR